MTERKYSVAEIDRMRGALRWRLKPKGSMSLYNEGELSARVEDQLRTYMMAGVDPDELVREAGHCVFAVNAVYTGHGVVVANNHIGYEINQPTADKPSKGQ